MKDKDYIPYIRKMVGHKRIISVGLSALIINEKNEILLEKRSDNSLFCLPGGSLDFDETVIEGVKREVKEETGIALDEVHLFLIISGKKEQFIYPNKDITDYVDLFFYSYVKGIDIVKCHDQESTMIKFYPLDSLPDEKKVIRGTKRAIDKLIDGNLELEVD